MYQPSITVSGPSLRVTRLIRWRAVRPKNFFRSPVSTVLRSMLITGEDELGRTSGGHSTIWYWRRSLRQFTWRRRSKSITVAYEGEGSVRVNDPLKYSVRVRSPVRVTIFQSAQSSIGIANRHAIRFTGPPEQRVADAALVGGRVFRVCKHYAVRRICNRRPDLSNGRCGST